MTPEPMTRIQRATLQVTNSFVHLNIVCRWRQYEPFNPGQGAVTLAMQHNDRYVYVAASRASSTWTDMSWLSDPPLSTSNNTSARSVLGLALVSGLSITGMARQRRCSEASRSTSPDGVTFTRTSMISAVLCICPNIRFVSASSLLGFVLPAQRSSSGQVVKQDYCEL